IDGVFPRDGVVEVAVLNHHLWLHEAGLRPQQLRHRVARSVEADTNAAFHPPVRYVLKPGFMILGSAGGVAALPLPAHVQAVGDWNLLTFGAESRILGCSSNRSH